MDPIEALRARLVSGTDARRSVGRGGFDRALLAGELVRIRRGWYVDAAFWGELRREEQHLVRIAAASAVTDVPEAAYSLVSAAALWELPVWGDRLDLEHIAAPHGMGVTGRRSANAPGLARHEVELPAADVTTVQGLRCTTLDRTVADLLRWQSRECALAAADAAVRRVAFDRAYRVDRAEEFLELVRQRLRRAAACRGIVQARDLVEEVDGRSGSAGESVSRLRLTDIGFARPRLQVPVTGPNGHSYWIDFGMDDVDVWGEFDGYGKYLDPVMTEGADPREVLRREKEREDWIRARTGRRMIRWTTDHIASTADLRAHLAALGVRPRATRA